MNDFTYVRDKIIRQTKNGATLLGTQCQHCNQVYFPNVNFCSGCDTRELKEIELGDRGVLFAYTTVNMKSAHFNPPYSAGYINLPGDIKIFSPLRKIDGKPFEVGMEMTLEVVPLWSQNNNDVIGYRFFPA